MKTFVLLLALVVVAVLAGGPATSSKSIDGNKRKGTIQFNDVVLLQSVPLKGEYLFVHDDAAMARGEACTRVYKGNAEISSKLVVSFHCVPVERARSTYFVVLTKQVTLGVQEVTAYQFKGDTEAHGVPTLPAGHVHKAF